MHFYLKNSIVEISLSSLATSTLLLATIISITIIIPVFFLIRKYFNKEEDLDYLNINRAEENFGSRKMIQNDKLIILDNVVESDLIRIISQVCNLYNEDKYTVLPRLFRLENEKFALTFPYDLPFREFCYLVNYFYYPHGLNLQYKPKIRAWVTTDLKCSIVPVNLRGKRIMLFVPESDDEFDCIYLVSTDKYVYKIGFDALHSKLEIWNSNFRYEESEISLSNFHGKTYQDFK